MFGIGLPELIIIAFVTLVLFGPGKMPEIGSAIGKAMRGDSWDTHSSAGLNSSRVQSLDALGRRMDHHRIVWVSC